MCRSALECNRGLSFPLELVIGDCKLPMQVQGMGSGPPQELLGNLFS